MVDIRLASEIKALEIESDSVEPKNLVTPGSLITKETGFMRYEGATYFIALKSVLFHFIYFRGHGTYMQDECLYASVAGIVERVNQLISVRPLKSRYHGEIGDVVIGRVTEVAQKRWKLDTNARLDSVLLLQSVNLPGGELVL